METLLTILRETEELFRIAEKCPSSELALILWKLDKAIVLEEYYAALNHEDCAYIYSCIQTEQYNRLAYFGYVPLDF